VRNKIAWLRNSNLEILGQVGTIALYFTKHTACYEAIFPPPLVFRLLALSLWLVGSWSAYGQQLPFQCPVQPMPVSPALTMQRGPAPLTTCTDVQNIRVNVHFLQHDDGSGNFTEFNDGHPCNPSTATTGYSYANALIWAANGQMNTNPVYCGWHRVAPKRLFLNVFNGCWMASSSTGVAFTAMLRGLMALLSKTTSRCASRPIRY